MKEITTNYIDDILFKLEIKPSLAGYRYWLLAIKIKLENPSINSMILYEKIAETCNATRTAVERGLGYARTKSEEAIREHFKVRYKIDNKTLLALIINELESVKYGY